MWVITKDQQSLQNTIQPIWEWGDSRSSSLHLQLLLLKFPVFLVCGVGRTWKNICKHLPSYAHPRVCYSRLKNLWNTSKTNTNEKQCNILKHLRKNNHHIINLDFSIRNSKQMTPQYLRSPKVPQQKSTWYPKQSVLNGCLVKLPCLM